MAGNNWWDNTPSSAYGAYAGNFNGYQDTEKGNVYSFAQGTPLGLPSAATYDPNYSTQYSAVYDTPSGKAYNFMHIANRLYGQKTPVPEPAGFHFADVVHLPGSYTGTTVTGLQHSFVEVDAPGTGVAELGVYDTAAHAFQRDAGGDIAPGSWAHIFQMANGGQPAAGVGSGSSGGGLPQGGIDNVPILGGIVRGGGDTAGAVSNAPGAAAGAAGAVIGGTIGPVVHQAGLTLQRAGLAAGLAAAGVLALALAARKQIAAGAEMAAMA